jgi:anaerobic magnesium-protoporphyrin IX monomethyl ester cyclase
MRWVFIRPANRSLYYDPEIQEPLGLECLAALLRRDGAQVLLLDAALDALSDVRLARRAAAFQPDAIGFSVMTAQEIESVCAIHAEGLRALGTRAVRWLAGGNFVTTETARAAALLPKRLWLVRCEGELALVELARRWSSPQGTAADAGEDRVLTGPPVEDLDGLPPAERPFADTILGRGWAFNLQGSRGCCGQCRYCSSPGMFEAGARRWRGRTPARLVSEMDTLHRRFGACSFNLIDEDFLGPPAVAAGRAAAMAAEIRRRNLRLSFGIQVRPASMSDEAIDALTSTGLTYVFMGLESDDPEDFRRWGRPWTGDPWWAVERLRRGGAEVNVGVLLFHSHSTFAGVRRFARRLRDYRLLEYRSATNRLDAMPGSAFHQEAVRARTLDSDATGPQPIPFVHPGMEEFYRDVLLALQPLGPPSMHAVCALPPALAGRRLDERFAQRCDDLRQILDFLDERVAQSFFAVLDLHEMRVGPRDLVSQLRQTNLETALAACRDMVDRGMAASFDALREAVRTDAGM